MSALGIGLWRDRLEYTKNVQRHVWMRQKVRWLSITYLKVSKSRDVEYISLR